MWHMVNFYAAYSWFEFRVSFSQTGYQTKVKEPSLHYYLSIAKGERRIHVFPKGISTKSNAVSSSIWTQVTDSIFSDDNRYA